VEPIFLLAVQLLNGEVIELVDQHARHWRGTADALFLVLPGSGEAGPVLEAADAYDVAERLVGLEWKR
jgi:hypothetical protein